jgi:hypothetical protein
MAVTGSVGGSLLVELYTPGGTLDTDGNRFSFVVYKQ